MMIDVCSLAAGVTIGLLAGLSMRATRVEPGVPAWVGDDETVVYGGLLESEAETVTNLEG